MFNDLNISWSLKEGLARQVWLLEEQLTCLAVLQHKYNQTRQYFPKERKNI